jgi:hypothetical protein
MKFTVFAGDRAEGFAGFFRPCLNNFPIKFSGTESGRSCPISSSVSYSCVMLFGTSVTNIRGHFFLIGTAFRRRSFRTCESASFNIESQRDSRSTAFSFRATILSTLILYSRFDRDFKIRFVSSVVRLPGQSGSGTMVILNFGGAGVVTGTCLTAGATVGARAAMPPYAGAAVAFACWDDTASKAVRPR